MPSLFRFLLVVGVFSAMVFGGLYVLSEFFEPQSKEVTHTLPGVKLRKQ